MFYNNDVKVKIERMIYMHYNGMLQKVLFLLYSAKNKTISEEDYQLILSYTSQHSDYLSLGKVFGYSISDYAIATLYWLQTSKSLEDFNSIFSQLDKERQSIIKELIESERYKYTAKTP